MKSSKYSGTLFLLNIAEGLRLKVHIYDMYNLQNIVGSWKDFL